ncbi:MAG: type II toxin-antitoxin system RelE/ParE family toxin [Prochloraceae cyanobacterium]
MTYRIVRYPQALLDIEELAVYIAQDNPQAAFKFVDATEQAFKQLQKTPEIGALRTFNNPRLDNMRVWPVSGFRKHLIFYRLSQKTIEILRVLHSARDLENIFQEE